MTCTSISTLTKGAASIPLLPAAPPTTASAWQAVRIALQSALQQIQAAAGVTGVNAIPQQYALFAGNTLPPFVSTSNCTPSLDTTNVLFGTGSLKLVLTGSPATIEFVASDAWPLHPNWQWIVSLFTMASATMTGELTITTSASGTAYTTKFTPGPETSGLARLADTLNLGADGSTGFGLSFTFTGGSGQSVWLDGLMMEPYFNTVIQPSPFISTSSALTLDNQPDGTTYARVVASDQTSNRIDFSKSLLNKQLDNIPDGATYIRGTASMGTTSDLPIQNAFCSEPLNSDSSVPGWIMPTAAGSLLYYDVGSPDAGYTQDLALRTPTTPGGLGVNQPAKFACVPGDSVAITARVKAPSGIDSGAFLNFYNAANSYLGNVAAATTATAWTTVSAVGIAPAGTAYAQVTFYCGAPASGQAYAALQWVRASINDVRVAGSGAQVGDQRNLLPILSAGAQAVWQNLSITYTAAAGSPATATISVSAAQILGLQNAGATVGYNASSANVTGTGGTVPTYFLYYIDPAYSGGTQTLYATTTGNDLRQQLGIVYIGSVAVSFPTSGSTSGSGGGGLCVTERMFIRRGRRAVDAIAGEIFDCADFPTRGLERFERALLSMDRGESECVRLISTTGCELECSVTTPFDLLRGGEALAPEMLGEEVLTDAGVERIIDVRFIGVHKVCRMHFGGISFAAGVHWNRRIYSHNTTVSKP